MTRYSAYRKFLKKWVAAFHDNDPARWSGRQGKDYWEEGVSAHKSLNKVGLLSAVTFQKDLKDADHSWRQDWRAGEAIRLLTREVKRYQAYAGELVEENRRFKYLTDFLDRMEKRFVKEQRCSPPSIARHLAKYPPLIRADRVLIYKERSDVWSGPKGIWGQVLSKPKHHKLPMRQLDLDGHFQFRIADIFRAFLEKETRMTVRTKGKEENGVAPYTITKKEAGVPLRTINRLVVLFYFCAGLAEFQDGHLILGSNGKKLTVGGVDQKIRRAGLK
jgi:hypothetical protein